MTAKKRASCQQAARFCLLAAIAALGTGSAAAGEFIRPQKPGDPLVYGIKDGIVVTVHPYALDQRRNGGPRGLLRVGYREKGKTYLIDYIAVEPVVGKQRGYSELQLSEDGRRGKRFTLSDGVEVPPEEAPARPPGKIEDSPNGRVLSFAVHVERFNNGARPIIEVALFERQPRRLRFRTFAAADSKPMDQCVLSATMGNQSRCRYLWLGSKAVFAHALYSEYTGVGFVEHAPYGLDQLHRTESGDVVAAISPDEFEPREVFPFPPSIWGRRLGRAWHHPGRWMAQFWLKPKGSYDDSLRCRVNGRRVYWMSRWPIPGGIAFESFEFRERFKPGRECWFGFATGSPRRQFGFRYDVTPSAESREIPDKETKQIEAATKSHRRLANGDFAEGLTGWRLEGGAKDFWLYETPKETALTTYGAQKDVDQGRIYQCFKVPGSASALRFYLCGGCDPRRLYVALWDGDRLWRRMTARNDNAPFEVRWNVEPLRGRTVTLEIVDRKDGPWGFIGAYGFAVLPEDESR